MTILDILGHHGHSVLPVVQADGRVVFQDASKPVVSGAPVERHEFHGGDIPEVSDTSEFWWEVDAALDEERLNMQHRFPGFVEIQRPGRPPAWLGTIDTGYGSFEIRVDHRTDHGLPWVVPVSPTLRQRSAGGGVVKAPHLYTNGYLCIAAQDDWDPSRHDASTVVAWAAHWHAIYVGWRVSNRWLSSGWSPDALPKVAV